MIYRCDFPWNNRFQFGDFPLRNPPHWHVTHHSLDTLDTRSPWMVGKPIPIAKGTTLEFLGGSDVMSQKQRIAETGICPWKIRLLILNNLTYNLSAVDIHLSYWCVSRREWMGMGVAGIIIHSYHGSATLIPYVKRTSKMGFHGISWG